jgi:hypothetical protein
MSAPAFGLDHEYVAEMLSLIPSSSALLDCRTHPTTVETRIKAMRRGIADKVLFRWAWKLWLKGFSSANKYESFDTRRQYEDIQEAGLLFPRFFQNISITPTSEKP